MVHISKGNSKIGKNTPNISLVPVKDCVNCKACKDKCYALKAFRMYPSVRKAWSDNSRMFNKELGNALTQVRIYLAKHKPELFRWHVAGDILNQAHLDGIIDIAREYPNTQFLVFTKRFDLNYQEVNNLKGNLSIVWSLFPAMETPTNEENFPIAYVQDGTETRITEKAMQCHGLCENCGICWYLKRGQSVWFNIH